MYRSYEDPHKLEEKLKEAEEMLAKDPENIEIACEVAELKERVNFAWQDDEESE